MFRNALHVAGGGDRPHDTSLTEKQKQEVIETCLEAFEEHYVLPDAFPRMKAYITERMAEGAYEKITNLTDLTQQLRSDLRDISGDRHIWVDIMENIRLTPGPPSAEEIAEKKKGNFGFTSWKKLDGDVGYLKLDGFQDPAYAGDTAVEAMQFLADSRAVVIDLRENHGGEGKMVHLVSSYFLPAGTQLNSLYFRFSDTLREGWTHDEVKGQRMLDVDLFLLVSEQTTSAAESLSYSLQSYGRATLVGETTRGAAHWVESYPYPDQGIFLEIPVARPINPVTQKDWEGVGVEPDVKVPATEALDEALRRIRGTPR